MRIVTVNKSLNIACYANGTNKILDVRKNYEFQRMASYSAQQTSKYGLPCVRKKGTPEYIAITTSYLPPTWRQGFKHLKRHLFVPLAQHFIGIHSLVRVVRITFAVSWLQIAIYFLPMASFSRSLSTNKMFPNEDNIQLNFIIEVKWCLKCYKQLALAIIIIKGFLFQNTVYIIYTVYMAHTNAHFVHTKRVKSVSTVTKERIL